MPARTPAPHAAVVRRRLIGDSASARGDERRASRARRAAGIAPLAPRLARVCRDYPRDALRRRPRRRHVGCVVMIPSVLAYAELIGVPPVVGPVHGARRDGRLRAVRARHAGVRRSGRDRRAARRRRGRPARRRRPGAHAGARRRAGAFLVGVDPDPRFAAVRPATLADLLSKPVLVGYLNGAALVLIGTQVAQTPRPTAVNDQFFPRIAEALSRLPWTHLPTLALGLSLIGSALLLQRFAPRVPGIARRLHRRHRRRLRIRPCAVRGIALLGDMPQGLPSPALPAVSVQDWLRLAPGALAIAFAGLRRGHPARARGRGERCARTSTPTASSPRWGREPRRGAPRRLHGRRSSSRTLTVAATAAGRRWRSGSPPALLLLFVLVLAPLLSVAADRRAGGAPGPRRLRAVRLAGERPAAASRARRLPAVARGDLGVLLSACCPGILVGIVLSVLSLLIATARPRDALLRRLPADGRFHDLDDDEPGDNPPGVLVYRAVRAAGVRQRAPRHRASRGRSPHRDPPVRCLVLDLRSVPPTSTSPPTEVLDEFLDASSETASTSGSRAPTARCASSCCDSPHRARLSAERFFDSASAAVDDFLGNGSAPR